MKKKESSMKKVPILDRFFYLIACLLTLGVVYIMKTIIVNALVEIKNGDDK